MNNITLLKTILDIRRDFKNNNLINTQEYYDIIKFLENDSKNFTINSAIYDKIECAYYVYRINLSRIYDHIFIKVIADDHTETYKLK